MEDVACYRTMYDSLENSIFTSILPSFFPSIFRYTSYHPSVRIFPRDYLKGNRKIARVKEKGKCRSSIKGLNCEGIWEDMKHGCVSSCCFEEHAVIFFFFLFFAVDCKSGELTWHVLKRMCNVYLIVWLAMNFNAVPSIKILFSHFWSDEIFIAEIEGA